MRLSYLAVTLVLLGATGLATAGPAGEQAHTIDLSALPNGPTLYIKCSNGQSLANCGLMSLWQQSNSAPHLQSSIFSFGGRAHQPDAKLLG